jgi:hypothetical protein
MATELPGWPHALPAFHEGERALQRRAGLDERMAEVGARVIRAQMPDPHRELFEKLPFLVVGALDRTQRPWASLVAGAPGFVRAPDATHLDIAALPMGADALGLSLAQGDALGLLGIEPPTRRRNRVNGVLEASGTGALRLQVRQSFGNCAKYIQARTLSPADARPGTPVRLGARLPVKQRELVEQADTFFIATASPDAGGAMAPNGGLDVSHRGGRPGFVRVDDEGGASELTAPDFAGNFFFNTFGNIERRQQAGLMFIDWARGDLLLVTGHARVVWEGAELAAFAGAQRLLKLSVAEGLWLPGAVPLRGSAPDYAPQLAATGRWPDRNDSR